jgi:hypothetical protein
MSKDNMKGKGMRFLPGRPRAVGRANALTTPRRDLCHLSLEDILGYESQLLVYSPVGNLLSVGKAQLVREEARV